MPLIYLFHCLEFRLTFLFIGTRFPNSFSAVQFNLFLQKKLPRLHLNGMLLAILSELSSKAKSRSALEDQNYG